MRPKTLLSWTGSPQHFLVLSSAVLEVFAAHKSEELSQGWKGPELANCSRTHSQGIPVTGKAELLSLARAHENPGNQDARAMHVGPGLNAGEHVPGTRCARLGTDSTSVSSLWKGSLRGFFLQFTCLSTLLFSPMKESGFPSAECGGKGGGDSPGPLW